MSGRTWAQRSKNCRSAGEGVGVQLSADCQFDQSSPAWHRANVTTPPRIAPASARVKIESSRGRLWDIAESYPSPSQAACLNSRFGSDNLKPSRCCTFDAPRSFSEGAFFLHTF